VSESEFDDYALEFSERAREIVSQWEHGDEAHRQWLRDVTIPVLINEFALIAQEATEKERLRHCKTKE
jgi:hypothetical protein